MKVSLWAHWKLAMFWVDQEMKPSPLIFWLYHWLMLRTLSLCTVYVHIFVKIYIFFNTCNWHYTWFFSELNSIESTKSVEFVEDYFYSFSFSKLLKIVTHTYNNSPSINKWNDSCKWSPCILVGNITSIKSIGMV